MAFYGTRATSLATVRAGHLGRLLGSDFGYASLLHDLTELLPDSMGMRLELVVMGYSGTLLHSLDLGSDLSGLLEDFSQFVFQFRLLSIHALSPKASQANHSCRSLTQQSLILLLTFSKKMGHCKS